jgi:hypothetical protein
VSINPIIQPRTFSHGTPDTCQYEGFELPTAVFMNSSVFVNVTPCNFRGCRVSQTRNQYEGDLSFLGACFMLISSCAYSSTPEMEATYSAETSVDSQRTRGIMTQNIELLIFNNFPSKISTDFTLVSKNMVTASNILDFMAITC